MYDLQMAGVRINSFLFSDILPLGGVLTKHPVAYERRHGFTV